MHMSQDSLAALLSEAKQQISVGASYRHYKSQDLQYTVKDIVINEADNQPYVIYQAQYGNHITFSRPVSVWLERVDHNGTPIPRFKKLQ